MLTQPSYTWLLMINIKKNIKRTSLQIKAIKNNKHIGVFYHPSSGCIVCVDTTAWLHPYNKFEHIRKFDSKQLVILTILTFKSWYKVLYHTRVVTVWLHPYNNFEHIRKFDCKLVGNLIFTLPTFKNWCEVFDLEKHFRALLLFGFNPKTH